MGPRIKAVVFGTGRRVERTIMPALKCLVDRIDVVAIYGRNEEKTRAFAEKWGVPYQRRARPVELLGAEFVIVSTTPGSVALIISELAQQDVGDVALMLDTPGLPFRDFGHLRTFKKFKSVVSAEDWFTLPTIRLAKRLIDEGAVGKLLKIWMMNSGHKHHAVAALRYLANSRNLRSMRRYGYGADFAEWTVRFPNGVRGVVIEPRDYDVGRIFIAGTEGIISDFAIGASGHSQIGVEVAGGYITGLAVNGSAVPADTVDAPLIERLREQQPLGNHIHDQMKVLGLARLLLGACGDDDGNAYPAQEAMYDSLAIGIPMKVGWLWDPGVYVGGSLLRAMAFGILPRFMPRRG